MSQIQLLHRETHSLNPNNEYIRQIRQMRNEVHAVNYPDVKEQGPISHALERVDNFAASEWTLDHMLRFQVIVLENQPGVAMFPNEYVVGEKDKTLIAAMKDEF